MKDLFKSLSPEWRSAIVVFLIVLSMLVGYIAWMIISYIMVEFILPVAPYLIVIVCMIGVGVVIGFALRRRVK